MFIRNRHSIALLAVAGLFLGAVSTASAQNYYPSNQQRVVYSSNFGGNGYCPNCNHAGSGCRCGYGAPPYFASKQCGLKKWLFCDGYCTVSPDHGWAIPRKVPVVRNPVVYQHYYPNNWYGTAPQGRAGRARVYPTIAMPTDTTQMGYYYQRVPSWQANRSMYPATPWPANFHYRNAPRNYNPQNVQWIETTPAEQATPEKADKAIPAPAPQAGDKAAQLAPGSIPVANVK